MQVGTLKRQLTKYFPVPKYLDIPSVGVDISPWAMRFVEILPYKDHFRIKNYSHDRLKKLFAIEDEDSRQEIKDILCRWKERFHLEFVEVSLPEEKAYLFTTNIPFGSDSEMRSSIEFNLEENVPINPSEAIFDYRIVHHGADDSVEVAVTVLPIDIVNKYSNLFEEADLKPISFLIEAQALSKALVPKNDKGVCFIVNIGELKTGLFISSEGSVQFTSTILLGGQDLTNDIIKEMNIGKEEAEKLKNTKGLSQKPEDRDVLSALIHTASNLKDEIEKIYIYWKTRQNSTENNEKDQKEAKIILCGKDALMFGFKEYIEQNLKIKTELGNVWTNVATFDQYIPPINSKDSLDFGRAIGLALPKID